MSHHAPAKLLFAALVSAAFVPGGTWAQPLRPPLSEPTVTADRKDIAFVSGGEIWRVAVNGGDASLLVSHPADESRPLYSPDGKRLAFVSSRTGGGDIYVLTLDTGELKRLTFGDGREQVDAWSRDGQWIYFHHSAAELSSMNDVYRVRSSGGTPAPVSADRYLNEFFAAPSPDGSTIALNARGIAATQWWRKGHSHLDVSEIYVMKPGPKPSYERITDGGAKEIWPMWSGDGKSLFFVSDRTGVENIWRQPIGGTSRAVTSFTDGRVLWPNISADGRLIVFERNFQIWKMEPNSAKPVVVPIQLRGASAETSITHQRFNSEFSEAAVSPDGKKLVVAVRGEIFAAPAQSGGDAQRVTRTHANEMQISWSPDSKSIVYVSDRDGPEHLFLYDFTSQSETKLTDSVQADAAPRFSPDGKKISFLRGGKSVWYYDLETKQTNQIAAAEVGRQPLTSTSSVAWSPDSKWIAYAERGARGFTNVMAAPLTGKPEQVTFFANGFMRTVQWSPDGKRIYCSTAQRTEDTQVARVDLLPKAPPLRESRFWDLFRSTAEKPGVPTVDVVLDGIRGRVTMLATGLDTDDFEISGDGKQMLLTANSAGRNNLYTYSLDEMATEPPVARQITSTSGRKSHAQFANNGKDVFFLEQGRVQSLSLEVRVPRPVALNAEMDVDFHQQKLAVFNQAWHYQRDNFFDEKLNGVDWAALRKQYEPVVAASRTPAELYRCLNLMLGELNASHMGISRLQRSTDATSYLGISFDTAAYESKGQFVAAEVVALGPAALAGIKPGDAILSVDGTKLEASTNFDAVMEHKAGKKVDLELAGGRKVSVRPVSLAEAKRLRYRAWVEAKRAFVDKWSGGKLGYVHIPDMSAESLTRLYLDLDADNHAKEGVVVDVRNNNGGFINAYALDVFARRGYLTFQERGRAPVPARSVLGQRSLELPTILVTNQHSLSDAEDFSEGYRRLRIGKVVGEPTAGWIVYTSNQELVDGSSLRLPRTKVFDNDGQLMEMHPRPVDVPVQRPLGETYTGQDLQLETAVRELLQQVESGRGRPSPSSNQ
ncbi:MAG: PD40 domain-containing protein [Bryobacterales bacterium]|nr:PD40 domain-containing protein [Bryobacterales bacterium]